MKEKWNMCVCAGMHVYAHVCYYLGNCMKVSREFLHVYLDISLVSYLFHIVDFLP